MLKRTNEEREERTNEAGGRTTDRRTYRTNERASEEGTTNRPTDGRMDG